MVLYSTPAKTWSYATTLKVRLLRQKLQPRFSRICSHQTFMKHVLCAASCIHRVPGNRSAIVYPFRLGLLYLNAWAD